MDQPMDRIKETVTHEEPYSVFLIKITIVSNSMSHYSFYNYFNKYPYFSQNAHNSRECLE